MSPKFVMSSQDRVTHGKDFWSEVVPVKYGPYKIEFERYVEGPRPDFIVTLRLIEPSDFRWPRVMFTNGGKAPLAKGTYRGGTETVLANMNVEDGSIVVSGGIDLTPYELFILMEAAEILRRRAGLRQKGWPENDPDRVLVFDMYSMDNVRRVAEGDSGSTTEELSGTGVSITFYKAEDHLGSVTVDFGPDIVVSYYLDHKIFSINEHRVRFEEVKRFLSPQQIRILWESVFLFSYFYGMHMKPGFTE